jgi:Oxidoreductase family, C-terminal alpha/beta domain
MQNTGRQNNLRKIAGPVAGILVLLAAVFLATSLCSAANRPGIPRTGPHGHAEGDHFGNFMDCVRSRKKENLNAPIQKGHISAALVHLANASYRLGRTLRFDPQTEQVIGDDEANNLLRDGDRGYRTPFVVPEEV